MLDSSDSESFDSNSLKRPDTSMLNTRSHTPIKPLPPSIIPDIDKDISYKLVELGAPLHSFSSEHLNFAYFMAAQKSKSDSSEAENGQLKNILKLTRDQGYQHQLRYFKQVDVKDGIEALIAGCIATE